jgi:hypothetical protein
MKSVILLSLALFSIGGGWIGAAISGNNWFSLASILGSTIGAFAGIWVGYKVGQYFL